MNMNSLRQKLWNWSLRCYRTLLRIYPRDFRGEFGGQLDQSFRDISRDESRRGFLGLAMLWARVLPDLAHSAIASRQTSDLGWQFRLRWVIACGLGFGLYPFPFHVINYFFGFPFYVGRFRVYIPQPPLEVYFAGSCLMLAFLQSRVVSNKSFDRKRWLLFTLASEAVFSILARAGVISIHAPSLAAILGFAGALIGFAQSLALRGRPLQVGLLLTANAISLAIIVLLPLPMVLGIGPMPPSFAHLTLGWAISGCTLGVITAAPLEWLLRTRPCPQES